MRAANVLAEVEIWVSSNAIFDDHDAPNPDTLVLAFPLGSVIDAGMAMPQPISTKAGFTENIIVRVKNSGPAIVSLVGLASTP